jgi:hypothetical protein
LKNTDEDKKNKAYMVKTILKAFKWEFWFLLMIGMIAELAILSSIFYTKRIIDNIGDKNSEITDGLS